MVSTKIKNNNGEIEQEILLNKIQNLKCPVCSKKKKKLYGFEVNTIISAIMFSDHTRNELVACLSCGVKAKLRAILITLFAGWWSKKRFKQTPVVLIKDISNFFKLKKTSTRVLNKLITEKAGYLKRKGTDSTTLTSLLKSRNVEHIPEIKG